jgi:succinoglycan biosynthesis protein ExoA
MTHQAELAESPRHQPELPFVSVIVPVLNEQGYIGRCLLALAEQDYPRESFEVFVLDGGSSDATVYETQRTAESVGLTVLFAPNPGRTTAAGFNLGLSLAHGQVIVKVDGHTRVAPDFLSASIRALSESGADAVGGPIETRGHGSVGRAIAAAMSSGFGIGDTAFRHEQAPEQWADSVPYGAYRREVFERVGNFAQDIDRGEDDEFNTRLRRSGGRILLSPSIHSVFFCRSTFAGLSRQYWGYGLAKAAVLRKHPSGLRPRHLVPSTLVLALTGGALLSIVNIRFGLVALLAGGAYTIANLVASLKTARATGVNPLYLCFAYTCIHLPAGAGMIAGFLRGLFPLKRRRGH